MDKDKQLPDVSEDLLEWLSEALATDKQLKINIDTLLGENWRHPKNLDKSILEARVKSNNEAAKRLANLQRMLQMLSEMDTPGQLIYEPPKSAIMLLDKVSGSIFDPSAKITGKALVNVGKGGNPPYVKVDIESIADSKNVKLSRNLTPYDKQVHNAVITLYEAEYNRFTAANVYSAMTGGKRGRQAQVERVADSLEKLSMTRANIDFTEEARKFDYKADVDTYEFKGNVLSTEGITMTSGGYRVDAYRLLSEPILYSYAKQSNKKITTFPAELLDVKELDSSGKPTAASISDTPDRITIKGELLQRIRAMARDEYKAGGKYKNYLKKSAKGNVEKPKELASYRRLDRRINFDNLFQTAGIDINNRTTVKRYRDYCFQCLDYWRVEGLFESWKAYKKSNKIIGVKIEI